MNATKLYALSEALPPAALALEAELAATYDIVPGTFCLECRTYTGPAFIVGGVPWGGHVTDRVYGLVCGHGETIRAFMADLTRQLTLKGEAAAAKRRRAAELLKEAEALT